VSHKLENYLRTYRKQSGLSQDEVAYLLGCQNGTKVSRYERFARKPSLETLFAYEVVFGAPAREQLLNEILVAICHSPDGPFKQRGLEVWHHAMRGALPVNIVDRYLGECIRIKSYEEFVQLAAIEATLATLAWTPVILNPTP